MGFLLDTNVISALGPARTDLSPKAIAWLARREASLFVSVISLMEIEAGIGQLRHRAATEKAERLAVWFDELKLRLARSLLDIDAKIALLSGSLIAEARTSGRQPDIADILIAATARSRDLTVVTRNVRHFEEFEIEVFNPFDL